MNKSHLSVLNVGLNDVFYREEMFLDHPLDLVIQEPDLAAKEIFVVSHNFPLVISPGNYSPMSHRKMLITGNVVDKDSHGSTLRISTLSAPVVSVGINAVGFSRVTIDTNRCYVPFYLSVAGMDLCS